MFRDRNGVNIIAARPSSFNTPVDPASVARRSKFTMAAKLAAAISSNSSLKSVWSPIKPDGLSVQNYLLKINYKSVSPSEILDTVKLVPDGGFGISAASVDKTAEHLRVDIETIGTNNDINTLVEVKVQLLSVLFLSDPLSEDAAAYSIIVLSSPLVNISLNSNIPFDITLMSNQSILFNQYNNKKAFFALVTLDNGNHIIHHSITLNG